MKRTLRSALVALVTTLALLPGAAFAGGGGQGGGGGGQGGSGGGGGGGTVTQPAAPTLLSPAAGGQLTVPFGISWSAVSDPAGIVAYNWEVSTSSSFASITRQNSTNGQTQDTVSGLANGSYFWRVQAVNGNFVQGTWSAARSFTVTGTNSGEPAAPTLNAPLGGTQFHPMEVIHFSWNAVPGASSYILEASTDLSFPILTEVKFDNIPDPDYSFAFGDSDAGNYHARVSAVNAAGVVGVPSNVINFSVQFNNPLPAPPTPLSPTGGQTTTLPLTFSWTSSPNPQPSGYEIEIADDSGFSHIEDDVPQINETQYTVLSLTPGTKFWRVRSTQGDSAPDEAAVTAWSAPATFTVSSAPPVPFSVTFTRDTPASGQDEQGTIQLTGAAPAGGAAVALTSSDPTAFPLPATVTIPAGLATGTAPFFFDAGTVTTPTTVTITATYDSASVTTTVTVEPTEVAAVLIDPTTITGGQSPGTIVELNGPAPAGGTLVTLSSNSPAASVPQSVTVPAGGSEAAFATNTQPVTANTVVTLTATLGGTSVSQHLTLTP